MADPQQEEPQAVRDAYDEMQRRELERQQQQK